MVPKTFYEDYPFKTWRKGVGLRPRFKNKFDSCVTDSPYHLASIVKLFGPGQKGINNQDENKKIMRRKPLTKKQAEEIIAKYFSFAAQLIVAAFFVAVIIYSIF